MSSQSSSLFYDEPSRRLWLLRKALEAVPFKEALQLAQAAQNFLDGTSPSDFNCAIFKPVASADRFGDAGAVPAIEPSPLPSGAAPAETSDTQEDEAGLSS